MFLPRQPPEESPSHSPRVSPQPPKSISPLPRTYSQNHILIQCNLKRKRSRFCLCKLELISLFFSRQKDSHYVDF